HRCDECCDRHEHNEQQEGRAGQRQLTLRSSCQLASTTTPSCLASHPHRRATAGTRDDARRAEREQRVPDLVRSAMSVVQGHGRSAPLRHRWAPIARAWAWYVVRAPRLTAAIATLLGLATLAEALLPRQRDQLQDMVPVVPVPASETAAAVVAVSGLLLLWLARGLRRRKRRAWQAAVVLSAVRSTAFLIHDEPRPADAAITLVLLVLLLAAAPRFNAKPDPRSRWFALVVLIQFTAVAVCYGLSVLSFSHLVVGNPSWS